MQKEKKNMLIIVITLAGLVLVCLLFTFLSRTRKISEDTIGNTAGNLNNKGLFCEYDGVVYFSNSNDNGTLYSMNPDETNVKKLSNSQVQYINASERYLVYYQSGSVSESGIGTVVQGTGLYRSDLNGKSVAGLDNCVCTSMVLAGNYIYYQHYDNQTYTRLYKININKSEKEELSKDIINPNCVYNGTIYYNGTGDDHYLYGLDTSTDNSYTAWAGNIWNPIIIDNYVYYMDLDNHYGISRYNMTNNTVERLTNDRTDYFNVYGSMIYYQTCDADAPALKRMNTDGSGNETVMEGAYKNINITSNYVYFSAFDDETTVYHTPTFGSISVSLFNPQSSD